MSCPNCKAASDAERTAIGIAATQAAEIEQLRAVLKPFAKIGKKFAPHCAPDKSWPPGASAGLMDLTGLQVQHFVEAFNADNQQSTGEK